MRTAIKYILLDLARNKVILLYALVLAGLSFSFLNLDGNSSKGLLSLLNVTLLFVPLIAILFSAVYFFNSIEFTELLLSHPIRRERVIMAEYLAVALSLSAAYVAGIGVLLTLIFSALALLIFVMSKDKTKGIGAAIALALFFALLFDGLLIAFIYSFSEYPIDKIAALAIAFNPIDLARVLMLLQLDAAVLMGYSGALFKKFLGSGTGSIFSLFFMILWVIIPLFFSVRIFKKKDL